MSDQSACPLEYALNFPREPKFESRCLYVAGGLYGNIFALERILAMAGAEGADVVFNGDIHWFDAQARDFLAIERMIADFGADAINGNVEFEIANTAGNGCGCFYPPCTGAGAVDRSNLIHARLAALARKECPQAVNLFKNRAKCELVSVGGARVAITHGDEKFLAGWGCSRESLSESARRKELDAWLAAHKIDALACTHTCAPAALALPHGIVINNGAAGMPNFAPVNLEFTASEENLKSAEAQILNLDEREQSRFKFSADDRVRYEPCASVKAGDTRRDEFQNAQTQTDQILKFNAQNEVQSGSFAGAEASRATRPEFEKEQSSSEAKGDESQTSRTPAQSKARLSDEAAQEGERAEQILKFNAQEGEAQTVRANEKAGEIYVEALPVRASETLKFDLRGDALNLNAARAGSNLNGALFGLITRIAATPSKEAIYRAKRGEIYVEALPVRYDAAKFLKWFDEIWGAQSPAAISYRGRIERGTRDSILDAMLGGFDINLKISTERYCKRAYEELK